MRGHYNAAGPGHHGAIVAPAGCVVLDLEQAIYDATGAVGSRIFCIAQFHYDPQDQSGRDLNETQRRKLIDAILRGQSQTATVDEIEAFKADDVWARFWKRKDRDGPCRPSQETHSAVAIVRDPSTGEEIKFLSLPEFSAVPLD